MSSQSKERPILFSGEMIRAILSGSKTQTRRVVKPRSSATIVGRNDAGQLDNTVPREQPDWVYTTAKCPYGVPGDKLYVRETWGIFTRFNSEKLMCVWYKASGLNSPVTNVPLERRFPEIDDGLKWHPSIFMPKKYARLWLEITEVRVQRLYEITEADAKAEGWPEPSAGLVGVRKAVPVLWFCDLWDSINAKRGYSWESNPFVWCLTFRKVD